MSTHAMAALIQKRREIAGEIEHLQDQLRQRIIDLDNLDATIRLFDPDIDLQEVKPKPFPPRHAAFKGEMSRLILGALRSSPDGLTAQQLAQHVMAERGMDTADKRTVRLIGKRVGSSLRSMRAKGLVESHQRTRQSMIWRLSHSCTYFGVIILLLTRYGLTALSIL